MSTIPEKMHDLDRWDEYVTICLKCGNWPSLQGYEIWIRSIKSKGICHD